MLDLSIMEMQIRIVIHWKKYIYDNLTVTPLSVKKYEKNYSYELENNNIFYEATKPIVLIPKYLNNEEINSYAVSAYVHTMKRSDLYRQHAMRRLLNFVKKNIDCGNNTVFLIKLRSPSKQFLDYKWGERLYHMALEKREIDHAMSWLSTLGGAFSALGDSFQHFAAMAEKISYRQIMLAQKLEDPPLVARSKLYVALSLMQQGSFKTSKSMIEDIYKYAKQRKDTLLQKMCKGAWAKLRYYCSLQRIT